MNKLRPYTIIPDELYVEREADRQLAQNLSEMGRPAYVLVARQMGKTNLLLNAKRKSGPEEVFCYIDLSNPLPDLRAFFHNIIDTCIDTHAGFSSIAEAIRLTRLTSTLAEHKEHENELRSLLAAFPGKLIICLDEIDALTKTDYSDRVFSLIRSTYFSGRTNFPELSRLTYVLSGVAEPTEIIRDRSISPFNIGEKIFLSDFSMNEFESLIKRADLHLPKDTLERIYYWTAGNPRISWDVCANIQKTDSAPNQVDIDQLVRSMYLQSYDLPPIDHIRALVENEKDIRDGLFALHYGRQSAIIDSVKTKLYLAGITRLETQSGSIFFKNKIIEEALSVEWLQQLEQQGASERELGLNLYREEKYRDALESFMAFEASGAEIEDPARFAYYKGSCLYHLEEYPEAIECFSKNPVEKTFSADFYYTENLMLASCYLRTGQASRGIELTETLLTQITNDMDGKPSPWGLQASLLLSSSYFASRPPQLAKAADVAKKVIADLEQPIPGLDASSISAYRNSALATLTTAYDQLGRRAEALTFMNQAIRGSTGGEKATLLLQRANRFDSKSERKKTLQDAVQSVAKDRVAIAPPTLDNVNAFTSERASQLMVETAGLEGSKSLDLLFSALSDEKTADWQALLEVVTRACTTAMHSGRQEIAAKILTKTSYLPICNAEHRYLTAFAFLISNPEQQQGLEEIYVSKYLPDDSSFGDLDHRVVFLLAQRNIDRGNIERAREIFLLASTAFSRAVQEDGLAFGELERLTFQYLDIATDPSPGNTTPPLGERVNDLRSRIYKYSGANADPYPKNFKSELLKLCNDLLKDPSSRTIVRLSPKIGRNALVKVKLSTGEVATGKFKKYETLINTGEAELISSS